MKTQELVGNYVIINLANNELVKTLSTGVLMLFKTQDEAEFIAKSMLGERYYAVVKIVAE